MADLLGTGISGLLASRVALDTTGHNIANLNTEGYSRQTAEFAARAPQQVGNYFVGQGVDVVGVQRAYSQYLTASLWSNTSSQQRASTFSDLTGSLNDLLGGSNNLQTSLDAFYGAVQDASNDPTSTPTRQALLGKAQSLASTFNSLAQQLDQQSKQVNGRIADTVNDINGLAGNIASLNKQIEREVSAGHAPSDLLDKRDQLIKQLSSDVQVTTSVQGNSINVFAGNGQTLVSGGKSYALSATANPYDATRTEIYSSSGSMISGQLQGGSLGALLDYRGSVLEPAQNQLGRTATAFATAFNAQHRQGMDLNGQLGSDVFALPPPRALPATSNAGSADIAVQVGDVSALTASDYTLRYDGSAWSMTTTGGKAVALSGSGTAADPFVADGLSFTVAGTAAAGDSFQIRPTRDTAGGLALQIDDPTELALAAPVKASAASGNGGTASIGGVSVSDVADPNLLASAQITFTSATTYQVNGTGSYTFTPGSNIDLNGWSLQLDGAPATGDSFTVQANSDGVGDNSNGLALGRVADLGVLDGGLTSAGAAYGQLVSNTGTIGAQAKVNLDAQTSLYNQAAQSQSSVAGVNLEEEGANLVRYQQSYQAAAQVIATANTIFDTLMSAVRG